MSRASHLQPSRLENNPGKFIAYMEKGINMKSKINYDEIIKLIDLLEARNLSEFELEVEGFRIKISRSSKKPAKVQSPNDTAEIMEMPGETPDSEQELAGKDGLHIIRSPMVGTFYRAPDPSSPPFVEIGETVEPNQTICIVEAMKLMNEIESDIEGLIEEIYVENGKSIEYGQKLFGIKQL